MIIKRSTQMEYTVYSNDDPILAKQWCEKNFGPQWSAITNREGRWTVFWNGPSREHLKGTRYYSDKKYVWIFTDEKDAMLFTLRWSE